MWKLYEFFKVYNFKKESCCVNYMRKYGKQTGLNTITLLYCGVQKFLCVAKKNHTSKISSTQYVTSRHLVSNPNKEKRKHVHYISCVCYMQKTDKGGFPISKLICRFGMVQYYRRFTCQI